MMGAVSRDRLNRAVVEKVFLKVRAEARMMGVAGRLLYRVGWRGGDDGMCW